MKVVPSGSKRHREVCCKPLLPVFSGQKIICGGSPLSTHQVFSDSSAASLGEESIALSFH